MKPIEEWLNFDYRTTVKPKELDGDFFTADNLANRIGVIVRDHGVDSPIEGGIVGYVIRSDEKTVVVNGQTSGNRGWIDLPASAYVCKGPVDIIIKNGATTIGACHGYINRSTTDTIVDPGKVIPSLPELLAELTNLRAATSAANTATSNANAATSSANTAASNANAATTAANAAAGTANTAASNADAKAGLANTAAGNANAKATLANTAAQTANTAASNADAKAGLANTAANNANTKATLANTAAQTANTAASNADEKAALANTAAGTANASATAADAATAAANTAAGKIDDMTVAATTSPEGSQASVTITEVNGHKHVAFDIPKGDKGKDFHIAFTFASIAAMEAYSGDIELFDYAMIDTGNVQDADTGKLYCYEQDREWHYIGDLSGAQGIKGETGTGIDRVALNADYTLTIYYDDGTSDTTPSIRGATGITPNISIGSVTTLTPNQQAYVELDQTSTPESPVINFGIPKGDTGTVENLYGSTLPMSPQDSTKVDVAINNKASKVSNATNGNFAGLDTNGNITDSGKKPSDILTQAAVVDLIYPVGSIYMSVASTSPATLFDGTTWEQLKDRFLLGAGDTYTAGDTGGNASHTLTTSEMPSHNHTFTGSAVDTGNESAGHTHNYTDYYATTTGSTAISTAQMAGISASASFRGVASSYNIIDSVSGNCSHTTASADVSTLALSGTGRKDTLKIAFGSNNSHTHGGANTHSSRTSDGISANHTHSVTASGTIGNSGDGTAFSILPPYLAVYMWKRTA